MEGDVRTNPYDVAGAPKWWGSAAFVAVATLLVWLLWLAWLTGEGRIPEGGTTKVHVAATDVREGVGQPLDAVRYNAPAWAQGPYCYWVVNRTTGASWWLVRMDDDAWHALTIGVGEAAPRLVEVEE